MFVCLKKLLTHCKRFFHSTMLVYTVSVCDCSDCVKERRKNVCKMFTCDLKNVKHLNLLKTIAVFLTAKEMLSCIYKKKTEALIDSVLTKCFI